MPYQTSETAMAFKKAEKKATGKRQNRESEPNHMAAGDGTGEGLVLKSSVEQGSGSHG